MGDGGSLVLVSIFKYITASPSLQDTLDTQEKKDEVTARSPHILNITGSGTENATHVGGGYGLKSLV